MLDSSWSREASTRAESALAALSPRGVVFWRQLRRWLVGAPGDPLPSRADPRILTRTRIRTTRSHPAGVADLIDVLTALAAFESDDDPLDAPLLEIWRPHVEAAIEGRERRHPLLEHWFMDPHGRLLGRVVGSMRSYLRVGLYWWERSGIPRRWMLEAKGVSRTRLARYILTQVGGFRPVWSSHLPTLPPHRHLTRDDFVASHLEMAALIRRTPEILGLASASWYYDPAIEDVSPRLAFAGEIVRENGGMVFEVRPDDSTLESALAASAERRAAAADGRYRPRLFARVWGRRAFLAWAARQPGWQMSLTLGREAP